jgi:hypothetical protein
LPAAGLAIGIVRGRLMLVEAEVWTVARTEQGNAVLVRPKDGEKAVPIFIGTLEAQAILIGLGNVPMPRPLTHDLLLSVLKHLDISLSRIEITELRDRTYYAQLILSNQGQEMTIDSRPSDSIALAVREKCPVYISDTVVEEAGVSVAEISETSVKEEEEEGAEEPQTEVDRLKSALNKAVEEENYEEAARIRDRINEIEGS